MIYTADTETIKNPDGSMRVWLADVCSLDGFGHWSFKSLDELFSWGFTQKEPPVLYFHNLKFDGPYLLNWAHDNGLQFAEEEGIPGTYTMLVTDRSVWFMGGIYNEEGKGVIIRDSLKKIPLSVAAIAKAYNTPMLKGSIDYKAYRPIGHEPTLDELRYIRNDTEIVARALKSHFDKGMNKLTAPADALEEFKHTVDFESVFVPSWWYVNKTAESFCRKAYCGGISWVNPDIKEQEVRHGLVYDYNSMYPSVMLAYPYPVGTPVRWYNTPPKEHPLYIARAYANIKRKPGKPACIRDSYSKVWVETEFEGELFLTSADVELLQRCYYGTCELLDGYSWAGEKGVFDEYVEHWSLVKQTTKGGERQIAKLMLNSLYGKFGTNPMRAHKRPKWDKGFLQWETCPPTEGKVFNVAVAAFVTAWARKELVDGIESCQGFCYCDTDSVHVASIDGKSARFTGKVHDTKFGHWKYENRFVRAKYLRQKTYIEEKPNGELLIAACGCPERAKNYITFDNFAMGASFKGKLRPVMRPGGVELVESRFTIRAPFRRF